VPALLDIFYKCAWVCVCLTFEKQHNGKPVCRYFKWRRKLLLGYKYGVNVVKLYAIIFKIKRYYFKLIICYKNRQRLRLRLGVNIDHQLWLRLNPIPIPNCKPSANPSPNANPNPNPNPNRPTYKYM